MEEASVGTWVRLILTTCASFWAQAVVTEERFVPALNIIAEKFNIPDDIAGATLMAAGASSPELFSSFVALFITHSALGLGTIVGSEIFNQLIICAGAIFASKSGKLYLDRAIVTREVGFYAISITVLYLALRDRKPDPNDPDGVDHIYISFWDAVMVSIGYVAYVLVCAKMDSIVAYFTKESIDVGQPRIGYGTLARAKSKRSTFPAANTDNVPFLHASMITHEPSENFKEGRREINNPSMHLGYETPSIGNRKNSVGESVRGSLANSSLIKNVSEVSQRMMGRFVDSNDSSHLFRLLAITDKPSDDHELHDLNINEFSETVSCFLWQQSYFYTKAKFGANGWHLRWFNLTTDRIFSVPNRTHFSSHRMIYPEFKEIEIDEGRLIIKIINPNPEKRDYFFMAPSKKIFERVVLKMEEIMDVVKEGEHISSIRSETFEEEFEDSDFHETLTAWPVDAGFFGLFFYIFLFPLRLLMQLTLPDVRHLDEDGNPTGTLKKALFASFMCLVWLIVGSYCMVSSLETLGELLNIPASIIGVTVSAAGTSLPNYIASKVAAEKGFGNMAVSNAFGSNTFNIMIGLGLPWLLYTSVGTGPYSGLRDDGITQSVLLLIICLLVFIVVVLHSGFVLYRWHGYLFITLYVAYIVFSIAQVYML